MLKSCRTCLLEDDTTTFTLLNTKHAAMGSEAVTISEMVTLCTGVLINLDEFSNEICRNCMIDLRNAYLFRQRVWFTETTLKSKFKDEMIKYEFDSAENHYGPSPSPNEGWGNDEMPEEDTNILDLTPTFEEEIKEALVIESDNEECNYPERIEVLDLSQVAKVETKELISISSLSPVEPKHIYYPESNPVKIEHSGDYKSTVPIKTDNELNNTEKTIKLRKRRQKKQKTEEPHPLEKRICDICGQILSSVYVLDIHMRSTHAGERHFSCEHCDFKSYRKGTLEVHMRKHTGEKPYECNICHKHYQTTSGRASHMRMHSDEAPYICDICGKAFKKNDYLKGHKKIHDPSIFIQCQFCGKTFNKSGNLKAHELTHSTERPHKCELCERGFIQKRYLRAHMKSCGKMPKKIMIDPKTYVSPKIVNIPLKKPIKSSVPPAEQIDNHQLKKKRQHKKKITSEK